MADREIKIALIICSTRRPRKGTSVATWVNSALLSSLPKNTTLNVLDLANYAMPISSSDPLIPAQQPLPLAENAYSDTAVNAWSQAVRAYDAFVFVTPQYNWSFPASVKCAIDHLFHEWVGKSALIVSYGARGGGLGAGQLRQVLCGCHMKAWEEGKVELPLGREGLDEGGLREGLVEAWEASGKKEELVMKGRELVEMVVAGPAAAAAGHGKKKGEA